MEFFKDRLKNIKAFFFDVDGVLSRQEVELSAEGELMRTSCAKDGYAIMYSIKKGYIVAVISGGGAPGIRERLEKLGIKDIYLKEPNKVKIFNELIEKYKLEKSQILYMGDDIPDYECMKLSGVPTAPLDACEEIKSVAAYISDKIGGCGCVRDVIAQTLKSQNKWMDTSCYVRSM